MFSIMQEGHYIYIFKWKHTLFIKISYSFHIYFWLIFLKISSFQFFSFSSIFLLGFCSLLCFCFVLLDLFLFMIFCTLLFFSSGLCFLSHLILIFGTSSFWFWKGSFEISLICTLKFFSSFFWVYKRGLENIWNHIDIYVMGPLWKFPVRKTAYFFFFIFLLLVFRFCFVLDFFVFEIFDSSLFCFVGFCLVYKFKMAVDRSY